MTIYEVNVTGLTLSENFNGNFDNEVDLNLIKTFTSYHNFDYIFNASLNMSSDIYIEATKEADYYIDDGGFWVFGKI